MIMSNTFLNSDSVLQRTAAGATAMREHTAAVAPKLRAMLFLIDGNATLGDLLDRAGSLAKLLEQQVEELVRLGLAEVVEPAGHGRDLRVGEATTPYAKNKEKPQDLHPLVAAKMQLMLRLEGLPSPDIDSLGAELLEAKTLRDLAIVARIVTNKLALSMGVERSQAFWEDAKTIIMTWRELSLRDET
jgi:hypothetical protein